MCKYLGFLIDLTFKYGNVKILEERGIEMKSVVDYINEFEERMSELENAEKNVNKDFKDVIDLTSLMKELDGIIDDLRKKYMESQKALLQDSTNEELKKQVQNNLKELDTFLKERALYELEIVSTMKDFEQRFMKIKLSNLPEDDSNKLKELYHDRENIIFQMKQLSESSDSNSFTFDPYDEAVFSLESADEYINYRKQLKTVDDQILNLQTNLNNLLFDKNKVETIETKDFNSSVLDGNLMDLFYQKEEILNQLKIIDKIAGPKVKLDFNGDLFEVPKSKKIFYETLLRKLKVINENIEKRTHNDLIVKLDEDILDKMDEPQKRAYLSSLILQIENVPSGILVSYIDDKMIPNEYRKLYLQIKKMLKNEKKQPQEWDFKLDENALSKMTDEEKVHYYTDFLSKLAEIPMLDPINIEIDDEIYKVDRKDREMFEKCYNGLAEAKKNLEQESQKFVEEPVQEDDSIKIDSIIDGGKKVLVTIENKMVTVLESNVKKLAEKHAVIKSIKSNLQNYATTVSEKISQTFSPEDDEMDFEDEELAVQIDEKYVKSLTDFEKKIYYQSLLADIMKQKITNEKVVKIGENTYQMDEKYERLFRKICRRIKKIERKMEKVVVVQNVRKAKYLDKIKRQLRKNTVRVGLGLGAMLCASFGLAKMASKTTTEEPIIVINTDDLNNDLTQVPESSPIDEDVVKIIDDALENQTSSNNYENLEPTETTSDILTDEASDLDDNIYEIKEDTPVLNDDVKDNNNVSINPLGSTFTLKDSAKILTSYDSSMEYNPLFKNDLYTTVGVQLQLQDGSIVEINYNDTNAKEIVEDLIQNGAVILARRAVANEGLQDYFQNGIDTGVFLEQSIDLSNATSDLQEIIKNSLSQGRGL